MELKLPGWALDVAAGFAERRGLKRAEYVRFALVERMVRDARQAHLDDDTRAALIAALDELLPPQNGQSSSGS